MVPHPTICLGDTSGTGVTFTCNPSTGEKGIFGEYLINAQGEDVVAGIRTPQIRKMILSDTAEQRWKTNRLIAAHNYNYVYSIFEYKIKWTRATMMNNAIIDKKN